MNLLNSGAALKSDHQYLRITQAFLSGLLVIYTANHEIVKITPLSAQQLDSVLFIVQADINENGERVDQGLFMLREKVATKLLDHGRDAAADDDIAYFAAKDGIYTYDATNIKAEKYGTVTDDLIRIVKVIGSDVIYVLTADNVLYKVTEEGTKKEVVDKVVNAKEIILDHENNLYFYTNENVIYVLVGDEVRKIEGLPVNPSFIKIINPPFHIQNGVRVIIDDKYYIVYKNATSVLGEYEVPDVRLTACSIGNLLIHYFGYNKGVNERTGFLSEEQVIYRANHDIVKITPLSAQQTDSVLFIVQADINKNGERVDHGLYMLRETVPTKLLDHGRDAAADDDIAYFAAKDGIYTYDAINIKAEKYGTVTDDLIGIAKVNGSDVIYVLTADNVLYKVTEEGTKKEVVDEVVNAKEIILDHKNNLYFYTNENVIYVLVGDEVRKIEGLPANPSFIKIINPPFYIQNEVPVIIDDKFYFVNENGTRVLGEYKGPDERLTACSVENPLIIYFSSKKKLYKYSLLYTFQM